MYKQYASNAHRKLTSSLYKVINQYRNKTWNAFSCNDKTFIMDLYSFGVWLG